ncbi:MAG: hypothetical protein HY286_20285 [Planctomycetes bacterium]|nr:hypothetical protein [Planctomycetota bacterium]
MNLSIFKIDARYLQALLATAILAIGQLLYQTVGGYDRLLVAVATAVAAELAFGKLARGKWPNVTSAYISGLSIVILTKPSNILWPFAIGALISIVSKYAIAYKGRHLFNPTNFSLCVMLLAASGKMGLLSTQWGNSLGVLAVVWAWGLFVVWRAKVLDLTLTYLICFIPLAAIRAAVSHQPFGSEIAPMTGPMQTLFMFFMITDPSTVMSKRPHRIAVVVIIALVECVFRMQETLRIPGLAFTLWGPSMFALFFVGPVAKWIDLAFLGGALAPRRPGMPAPAAVAAA